MPIPSGPWRPLPLYPEFSSFPKMAGCPRAQAGGARLGGIRGVLCTPKRAEAPLFPVGPDAAQGSSVGGEGTVPART
jgi:hypothetical protein